MRRVDVRLLGSTVPSLRKVRGRSLPLGPNFSPGTSSAGSGLGQMEDPPVPHAACFEQQLNGSWWA